MTPNDASTKVGESVGDSDDWIRYEWSDRGDPSTVLIEAVAAETDRDVTTMPPLYDHVDPEALNALVATRTGVTSATVTVSFTYDGIDLLLDSDGTIGIRPAPNEGR